MSEPAMTKAHLIAFTEANIREWKRAGMSDAETATHVVGCVLTAMREPSEATLNASPILDTWTDETGWHTSRRSALASWQFMLNHLLAEPEGGACGA